MRRWHKLFIWIPGSLLGLCLLAIGLAYLFKDSITQKVVEEVNRHLNTEVSVAHIEYSMFREFPKASVTFENVRVAESQDINADTALASFNEISLSVNLWDLVRGKIRIQSLRLEEGYLSLATNEKGEVNYHVLKPDTSAGSDAAELSVKKLTLHNVSIHYKSPGQQVGILGANLSCSGNFKEEIFNAEIEGNSIFYLQGKSFQLSPKKVLLNTRITVDKPEQTLRFDNTSLTLESMTFLLNGSWGMNGEQGRVEITTENTEIKHLLGFLPQKVRPDLENYQSSGSLSLNGTIEKKAGTALEFRSRFSVENGRLFLKEFGEGLNGIEIKGSLEYTNEKQSLELEKFQARLMDDLVRLVLKVEGFEDPYIDAFLLGEFNLHNLKRIADFGAFNESSGRASLDISLKARLSELKDPAKYSQILLDGKIKGAGLNLGADSNENRLRNVQTFLEIDQSECHIHRLDATWKDQDIQIRGEARNFLSYFFNEGELTLLGRLKTNSLSLTLPKADSTQSDTGSPGFSLPPRITLESEVEVGKLVVGKFGASEISGRVVVNSSYLELRRLQFNSCEGSVKLNGHWNIRQNGDQPIVINAELQKVNVREVFRQLNNFGQNNLTDKHLNGKLSGTIDAGFMLDGDFNFLPKSLYAFCKLKVESGELNDYEPMLALSRFVRVEDLKRIRFNTLENEIEIRDETVFIPSMNIQSNALNLKIEGKHRFDHFMEYHLELQLKELLAGPYRSAHEPDEFEEDSEQGIRIHLIMSGTPDKLTIRRDSKSARKSFREEMKKEGRSVKQILKDEFGIDKKVETEDEVPNWEDDLPE